MRPKQKPKSKAGGRQAAGHHIPSPEKAEGKKQKKYYLVQERLLKLKQKILIQEMKNKRRRG